MNDTTRQATLQSFAAQVGAAARRAQRVLSQCDDEDNSLLELFRCSDRLLQMLGLMLRPVLRGSAATVDRDIRADAKHVLPLLSMLACSPHPTSAPSTPPATAFASASPCTPPSVTQPRKRVSFGATSTVSFECQGTLQRRVKRRSRAAASPSSSPTLGSGPMASENDLQKDLQDALQSSIPQITASVGNILLPRITESTERLCNDMENRLRASLQGYIDQKIEGASTGAASTTHRPRTRCSRRTSMVRRLFSLSVGSPGLGPEPETKVSDGVPEATSTASSSSSLADATVRSDRPVLLQLTEEHRHWVSRIVSEFVGSREPLRTGDILTVFTQLYGPISEDVRTEIRSAALQSVAAAEGDSPSTQMDENDFCLDDIDELFDDSDYPWPF